MRIDEVLTETIIAIYSDPAPSIKLLLKGGSAIRLFDNLTSRLSVDADFSISDVLTKEDAFFKAIQSKIVQRFERHNFDIIDFNWNPKPRRRKDQPTWWGGWRIEFKIVSDAHREKSLATQRRNALIPEGASSSKITVEISEHEYFKKGRTKTIGGVKIHGYTRELIVLEKIRAICQQHPDYKIRRHSANRARDFYDIYELTKDVDDDFAHRCSGHIENVFKAKEVPLHILSALWEEDFIDSQRQGFDQVRDTVRGTTYDFDVYVENLRFLVKEIYPEL